jgi:hypothetical protein
MRLAGLLSGGTVLAALVAVGAALIAVEIVQGRSTHPVPIAAPCQPRPPLALGGIDGTIQQVVLTGLDRAACRLDISREALVLAIGGNPAAGRVHWDTATINAAVRTGLLGALAEANHRGVVPAFAFPLLKQLIRHAPIEQLMRGGISLGNLFG